MMEFGQEPRDRSFPELLAAYADGELDAADRARVEAWLAEHPEARAAVENQQRLSRRNRKLWKAAAPLGPSESNWARVFNQVQDVLDAPRPAPPAPRGRRHVVRFAAGILATAAAAALAIHLTPPKADLPSVGPLEVATAAEVFALASDADVDVISIDDRDAAALVVGKPPLPATATVVLAAAGDVDLKGVQKAADGMLPKADMNAAGSAPMIIAPMAGR